MLGLYAHGKGTFRKPTILGAQAPQAGLYQVREGDFVLNITFAWEGAVAIIGPSEDARYVSGRFPTFRARPEQCDARYLLNYFKTEAGNRQLVAISPGSAGRNRVLSLRKFLDLPVPLPALSEQMRIVETIDVVADAARAATDLRGRAIKNVSALLVNMAWRPDLDEGAKLDEGWTWTRLSDVATLARQGERVDPHFEYPNVGIYSYARGLFRKPPIQGAATSADVLYRIRAGQFIYSRLFAFEGAYGLVTREHDGAYVSNEYPTFDCDGGRALPEFLFAYFKNPDVWTTVAAGSKGLGHRRQRVAPEHLLGHALLLPPMSWQQKIAAVMGQAEALSSRQRQTAVRLSALLPALLNDTFASG